MIYTISDGKLSAEINSLGAELSSLKLDGVEYMWVGDMWPSHAPLLFPICGRLVGGKYEYDGKEYNLCIHGFAKLSEFSVEQATATRLVLSLADSEDTPTLIFDEIDTGISGKTSQKIGFLMKKIAKSTQVLCVTHSAQLASSANSHYKISKSELGGRTETYMEELDMDGRGEELARILGGVEITETVRANAMELLQYTQ